MSMEDMMAAADAEDARESRDTSVREKDMFDAAPDPGRPERAATSGLSMEDMMDAEAAQSPRERDLLEGGVDDDPYAMVAAYNPSPRKPSGEAEAEAAQEPARTNRAETSGLSMEDMMDAESSPKAAEPEPPREQDIFGDAVSKKPSRWGRKGKAKVGIAEGADGGLLPQDSAEELSEAPVAPARPESSGLSMEDQMMAAQDAASPSREMDFEAMMGSEPAASSRRSAAERAAAQASLGVEETSPNPLADTEAAVLDGLDDLAGLAGEVATHDNPLADGQEMSKAEALLVQARQRNLGAEPETPTTVYVDESGAAVDNFDL